MSSLTVSFAASSRSAVSPFAAAASVPLPAADDCYSGWHHRQPTFPETPRRPTSGAAPVTGNLELQTAEQTEDPCDSELVWRELSAELDSQDPLAAAAASAARAAASQPESTVPPGVAARLRTLLPGLNRATLMVGSQTALLALPPPEESYPSGSSSCSLSLPLRAAAAQGGGINAPHRGEGEGEGEEEGSITFELAQPPNASLLRLLERFARLLSRRLGAERQHLAKAQLEDSFDEASEAVSRGASLESATSSMLLAALRCPPDLQAGAAPAWQP